MLKDSECLRSRIGKYMERERKPIGGCPGLEGGEMRSDCLRGMCVLGGGW